MDAATLHTFDQSLTRCNAEVGFLDRFYERFMESSPKVREKFRNTDFERQKMVLRASFYLILMAAEDEAGGPERYLDNLARRHGASQLAIGAELYDLWLDSLIGTVREFDRECTPEVERAWERVMGVGISFLLSRYHRT